ncbi:sigma-70 family RNA polymerase sigma factor [Myceligenerans pegani]|uniref:Sigma-70 family RNA polymerase sigma factor n=1 Tax=Myceligenerans pegani TaxID=2776917 RepID=A0ABR9MWS9_9MICO|nr:sigma-70 family RNA polymerase sigma factor [Myceligenerans sp. TRM 65318]MBE1875854.1 sigma-70 family RNA polymerase sigma factor [Myceligenerans sp. TRM 65318]MBE3018125.1 sigma-70 family RNA polymerase sigma factor [Myceligenerans sp. TRM 65318]
MPASSLLADRSEPAPAERKRRTARLLEQARSVDGAERRRLLDEVILLNIPVALSLAARYRNRGQPLEDLEQVACLALTHAVRAFRPDRGDDLLVFAMPCILGELRRHFRDTTWTVRPPRRVQELRPRVFAAEERLAQTLRRPPRPRDLADDLDCEQDEIREAWHCGDCASPASLDEPLPGRSGTVVDQLADDEAGYSRSEAIAVLAPACRRLGPRDRKILRMRYYEQLRQNQIAERLGISQVQVSRLLRRILRDLRRSITAGAPRDPAGTSAEAASAEPTSAVPTSAEAA